MKKQMLYKDLAKYYDLIYHNKDYRSEAAKIKKIILKYKKSKGKTLVEVACGTGHHLKYLKSDFSCIGIDISPAMLKIAKNRIKGVAFKKADMISFSLNKKFDVITCLFSSIGYVKTYSNLKKTIQNFSNHLAKGGVVIIEPWFNNPAFNPGWPYMDYYDSKEIKIARVNNSKVKGNISILDMHYLIAEKNKKVKHYVDKHELGLFDIKKTLQIMKESNLNSKFFKNGLRSGRGIFIGVKK